MTLNSDLKAYRGTSALASNWPARAWHTVNLKIATSYVDAQRRGAAAKPASRDLIGGYSNPVLG
jgi:hypothetical protein